MASSRLSDASSHTGSLDKFAALSEEWLVWYAYMRIRVEIYIKDSRTRRLKWTRVIVENRRDVDEERARTMFYVILYKDMEFLLRPMIFL